MTKTPFKKGRRFCCFCGGGKLAKEHIWPQWAAPLLPGSATYYRRHFLGGGGLIPGGILVHQLSRQGSPKTIRLTAVCSKCNSGWMSRLEEEVRPYLEPMLKDEALTINAHGQNILAMYFTTKAMVSDQSRAPHAFVKKEREDFYRDRIIPKNVFITLFRYPQPPNQIVTQYNKEIGGYFDLPDMGRRYVANITFRFAFLFIQVLVARHVQGQLKIKGGAPFPIHPPIDKTMRWPPIPCITTSDAKIIQHILEWARLNTLATLRA